eukprot:TRINITY_DN12622_c0_g1_i1.p2 TRINITY_DN12622_c0_g1~~TRINITY_DN12622_c0_g1_i1.p2  ORF type:complete len:381 (+),score=51.42 TRINITY_DN12622_c0_g1_i1:521-1663(+)
MKTPTSNLPQSIKDRIFNFAMGFSFKLSELRLPLKWYALNPNIKYNSGNYLIPKLLNSSKEDLIDLFQRKNYHIDVLNEIQRNIEYLFKRANHQIEFNSQLPYNEEYQKIFRGYIDEKFFTPISEIPSPETDRVGIMDIGREMDYQIFDFLNLYKKLCKLMHVANAEKLKILQSLNIDLLAFSNILLFDSKFRKTFTLEEFSKRQNTKIQDILRDFKSRMFDSHFCITEMVDNEIKLMKQRNEERKKTIIIESDRLQAEERDLPPDVIISLKSFQSLLNTFYERAGRDSYERSMKYYYKTFQRIISKFIKNVPELVKKKVKCINPQQCNFETLYQYQQNVQYENFDKKLPLLQIQLFYEEQVGEKKKIKRKIKCTPELPE